MPKLYEYSGYMCDHLSGSDIKLIKEDCSLEEACHEAAKRSDRFYRMAGPDTYGNYYFDYGSYSRFLVLEEDNEATKVCEN